MSRTSLTIPTAILRAGIEGTVYLLAGGESGGLVQWGKAKETRESEAIG